MTPGPGATYTAVVRDQSVPGYKPMIDLRTSTLVITVRYLKVLNCRLLLPWYPVDQSTTKGLVTT